LKSYWQLARPCILIIICFSWYYAKPAQG
jgi:hypothetical protein